MERKHSMAAEAQALLAEAGIPEKARGETLTPQQLAALSALLYREKTANA